METHAAGASRRVSGPLDVEAGNPVIAGASISSPAYSGPMAKTSPTGTSAGEGGTTTPIRMGPVAECRRLLTRGRAIGAHTAHGARYDLAKRSGARKCASPNNRHISGFGGESRHPPSDFTRSFAFRALPLLGAGIPQRARPTASPSKIQRHRGGFLRRGRKSPAPKNRWVSKIPITLTAKRSRREAIANPRRAKGD